MMRIIARHVALVDLPDPGRFCAWAREVATVEGAEGWAAPAGVGAEVWFEGPAPVVEAMIEWCASISEMSSDQLDVAPQRPVLRGGFEILETPPGA
jgi:hypothetical protein